MSELKTAVQCGMARSENSHPIPPITDPMGKHWKQPIRFEIEIDKIHALMGKRAFDELQEYSYTNPSGIYPGKMWKAKEAHKEIAWVWVLRWFGEHEDPNFVIKHQREILVV